MYCPGEVGSPIGKVTDASQTGKVTDASQTGKVTDASPIGRVTYALLRAPIRALAYSM